MEGGSVARGSVVSSIMASGSDEKKLAFTVVGETLREVSLSHR